MARRIHGRAVRRAGELLKTFNNERARTDLDDGVVTQTSVAREAGMSKRQQVTAVRVANISEPEFEAAVESDNPPSVTKLAEMGKWERELKAEKPEGFKQATALLGAVARFADFCEANDPTIVAGGLYTEERVKIRGQVTIIDGWLDRLVVALGDYE